MENCGIVSALILHFPLSIINFATAHAVAVAAAPMRHMSVNHSLMQSTAVVYQKFIRRAYWDNGRPARCRVVSPIIGKTVSNCKFQVKFSGIV